MRITYGKLPREVLEKTVFKWMGAKRKDVLLWPAYGEDAAVVKVSNRRLVVTCDPITGSRRLLGWLSVHINANDVAVCGARPAWFSSCILLPEGNEKLFASIVKQIHKAASELHVSVITGHSEVALYVSEPIIIGTMIGVLEGNKYYRTRDAKPGDKILMTKTVAIEGTAILATDLSDILSSKVDKRLLRRASAFYKKISVVDEAMIIAPTGLATAMHDPTEGGLLGGLYEMAEASGTGFVVYEDAIPIARETKVVCEILGCDPLKLISSGTLIASIRGDHEKLLTALKRAGVKASIIGEVVPKRYGRKLIRSEGTVESIKSAITDELWRILLEHPLPNYGIRY
ncbi:MAG: AIR synthase family protein [Nitrososphaerota archaeon]|nr:AIR synthase family protein [Nitrososphaerota archaeon]